MAVACIGVGDGGHCFNPQPDLPCSHSTDDNGQGAGGVPASAGTGPILTPPVSGAGVLNVSTGGAHGDPGVPRGDAGEAQTAAEGGDSSVAAGAGGEAGSAAGSGGTGDSGVVH
jgi:hypothetical protein